MGVFLFGMVLPDKHTDQKDLINTRSVSKLLPAQINSFTQVLAIPVLLHIPSKKRNLRKASAS